MRIGTVKKSLAVQEEGVRRVKGAIKCYNLGVLPIGNPDLKDYLVQGYIINEKGLARTKRKLKLLKMGLVCPVGRSRENTRD